MRGTRLDTNSLSVMMQSCPSVEIYHSDFFFQRAAAAVFATSLRFSGVSFVSRAFAPLLPSATAAGFFLFAINTMLSAQ